MQFSKTQNVEFGNFLVLISHRRRHLSSPSSTHRGNRIILSQLFDSNFGSYPVPDPGSHASETHLPRVSLSIPLPPPPLPCGSESHLLQNQPPRGPPIRVQNGPAPAPRRPNNPRRLLFPGLPIRHATRIRRPLVGLRRARLRKPHRQGLRRFGPNPKRHLHQRHLRRAFEKQRHLGSDPSPLRLGPPHRLRFRPRRPRSPCCRVVARLEPEFSQPYRADHVRELQGVE